MTTLALLNDVAAFNEDPTGVIDDIVDRIKQELRNRYEVPLHLQIKIGPSTSQTAVWMIVDEPDCMTELHVDLAESVDLAEPVEQLEEQPFFSTDPNYLVNSLRCDGHFDHKFLLGDSVHTNGSDDFCVSCFESLSTSQQEGFTLCTVRERCDQHAQHQASSLMSILGMGFAFDTPEHSTGA
jgi:hypothetical protein